MEREIVLAKLYEALSDKSCVLTDQRCAGIDHSEKDVVVRCTNGKEYRGDLLVAADGVNSRARAEMRRLADPESEGLMKADKNSKSCSFSFSKIVILIL
jgi:FAD dependent monooxygenase